MIQFTTSQYEPHTRLDDEFAQLGYDGMSGWPDQRPVTAALVRSRLRPAGSAPPTRLVQARTSSGVLAGATALRYPPAPGAAARLWGPVVAFDWQRHGLGTMLLEQATRLWSGMAMPVRTAEIPETRKNATRLFTKAGWTLHAQAVLMRGAVTTTGVAAHQGIRAAWDGDAAALASLYQTVHPEQGSEVAAGTLRRWRADERYVSDGLLVVPGAAGELLAAVLAYPLAHGVDSEPPEVLLGDVLVHPHADRATVARPLIAAGIAAGARHGAKVARAVIHRLDWPLIDDLTRAGLEHVDTMHYYQAPATAGA